MPIWDREHECIPLGRLQELQLERLRETVSLCEARSPLYRRRLKEHGVSARDIRHLEDVRLLPFTTKDDLERGYPWDLLAVPGEEVCSIHAFPGRGEAPVLVAFTREDLDHWADLSARVLTLAGVKRESVVQVAFGHGLLSEALGLHQGAERIGARLVPTSVADTRRQVQLIRDLGTTHLACTPTYALQVVAASADLGVKLGRTRLEAGILGGEPWSEMTRLQIESQMGVETYDHYGPNEVLSAAVAAECRVRDGLHIFEDHFLVEVIDPGSGEAVPEGAAGELTITTLTRRAMPLLRYRTGDVAALTRQHCDCGRTLARMTRVRGRTDDMLVIRGVNVFPAQVEQALYEAAGSVPHYQLVVGRPGLVEDLELRVEVTERLLSDEMKNLRRLEADLQGRIQRLLGLTTRVTFVERGGLPAAETAAERVVRHPGA